MNAELHVVLIEVFLPAVGPETFTLDAGPEWIENRLLESNAGVHRAGEEDRRATFAPHFSSSALQNLYACLEVRDLDAGQPLFSCGEPGDALYVVRGRLAVALPLPDGSLVRLCSFGPRQDRRRNGRVYARCVLIALLDSMGPSSMDVFTSCTQPWYHMAPVRRNSAR